MSVLIETSPKADLNYQVTKEFMSRVVNAGDRAGVDLFIGGDPAIQRFYNARRTGLAIEMLLNSPPADADPDKWAVRIMETEAARSVRERKVLVQSVLIGHGARLLKDNPDKRLKLLSIASGWSQLPLDVMGNIDVLKPGKISGFFVDQDAKAIEASRRRASLSFNGRVRLEQINAFALRHQKPNSADLIESTGFTDYFPDGLVARLFTICRNWISDDGVAVITNIISRKEEAYLDIVWGKMIRRTPQQLAEFAKSAGFDPTKTRSQLDQTQTMCVVVARP